MNRIQAIPGKLRLPKSPFNRAHDPKEARYEEFGPCLRWEYGFHCAFCLSFERDLIPSGGFKSRIYSAEHHKLKSVHTKKRNEYENCHYACMYCNGARGISNFSELLDPCADHWGNHFVVRECLDLHWDDGEIHPRVVLEEWLEAETPRGFLTELTYDINSERKRFARWERRAMREHLSRVTAKHSTSLNKLAQAELERAPAERLAELKQNVAEHEADRRDLEILVRIRHRTPPADAKKPCFCGNAEPPLPVNLEIELLQFL